MYNFLSMLHDVFTAVLVGAVFYALTALYTSEDAWDLLISWLNLNF